jgi:hypothetical protein
MDLTLTVETVSHGDPPPTDTTPGYLTVGDLHPGIVAPGEITGHRETG